MNTTNLFVELIVIGVGTSIWIILFVFSLFGFAWVPIDNLSAIIAAIPIIAVIYVLGIISDRIADIIFGWIWVDDLRKLYFDDRQDYYNSRRIILTQSERLSELLEYGRSRMRICRGWTLNLVLIALTLNAFVWTNFSDSSFASPISVFGSISLLVLAFGAWFAWRDLTQNEYRKIKEQAEFIVRPDTEGDK